MNINFIFLIIRLNFNNKMNSFNFVNEINDHKIYLQDLKIALNEQTVYNKELLNQYYYHCNKIDFIKKNTINNKLIINIFQFNEKFYINEDLIINLYLLNENEFNFIKSYLFKDMPNQLTHKENIMHIINNITDKKYINFNNEIIKILNMNEFGFYTESIHSQILIKNINTLNNTLNNIIIIL